MPRYWQAGCLPYTHSLTHGGQASKDYRADAGLRCGNPAGFDLRAPACLDPFCARGGNGLRFRSVGPLSSTTARRPAMGVGSFDLSFAGRRADGLDMARRDAALRERVALFGQRPRGIKPAADAIARRRAGGGVWSSFGSAANRRRYFRPHSESVEFAPGSDVGGIGSVGRLWNGVVSGVVVLLFCQRPPTGERNVATGSAGVPRRHRDLRRTRQSCFATISSRTLRHCDLLGGCIMDWGGADLSFAASVVSGHSHRVAGIDPYYRANNFSDDRGRGGGLARRHCLDLRRIWLVLVLPANVD